VRKIISILVTLGVILGLTLAAAPVAAQTCVATVALAPDNCATHVTTYTITYVAAFPVTLLAGNDKLSFDFADGTTFGAFADGDITVTTTAGTFNVLKAAITTSDAHLEFVLPVGADIAAGDPNVVVVIPKVVNTATDGVYKLGLDYQQVCCDPVVFDCADYTIIPLYSTLGFHLDFDKTYAGVAEDFIPPFKACGQENYGEQVGGVGWMTVFDLILRDDIPGCLPPCGTATMWFVLTECPEDEVVTFYWDVFGANTLFTLDDTDVGDVQALAAVVMPPPPPDKVWTNWIHFSSPGDYELCFYLECPAVQCTSGAQIVAEICMPAKVHQWKDAGKMELEEKWNLISLPLVPFDTSIDNLLLSLDPEALDGDGVDDLLSIWHYEWDATCTAAEWKQWPGPLTTMEDGKSYWARMTYPDSELGNFPYTWWVWGHYQNMPPLNPLAYDMCPGWDMFGFTSLANELSDAYLWNFGTGAPALPYPLIYGWLNTGDWETSDWQLVDPLIPDSFVTGQGYWGYFPFGGTIVP